MISAAIRVLAQTAAIQMEEAAGSAGPSSFVKGKARATHSASRSTSHIAPLPRSSVKAGRDDYDAPKVEPGPSKPPIMPGLIRTPKTIMPSSHRIGKGQYGSSDPQEDNPIDGEHNTATYPSDGGPGDHPSPAASSSLSKPPQSSSHSTSASTSNLRGDRQASVSSSSKTPRKGPASNIPLESGVSAADPIAPDTITRPQSSTVDPEVDDDVRSLF